MTALALMFSSCLLAAGPAPEPTFVVGLNGRDTNPGTEKQPFATITRAQQAVRQMIAPGLKDDVTVLIRRGTYALAEPLAFGPEDGGTAEHAVTYLGEANPALISGGRMLGDATPPVRISGGRKITGWKRGEGNLWATVVPGVEEGTWTFRELFVNNVRAIRARMPNVDADPPGLQLAGAELSADSTVYRLVFQPGIVKPWRNLSDVEVNVFGEWETMRKRLQSVDAAANAIVLQPPHVPLAGHPWNRPTAGKWCVLENAIEFLDHPGEWYLDRTTGVLTYWPRPSENMRSAETVAPLATQLVRVIGTSDRPVRNLHFRGISFAHCAWPLAQPGYQGIQANHYSTIGEDGKQTSLIMPAALHFEFAEGCSVTEGDVSHLGGCGLFLSNGCHRNVIEGNRVFDIGGNGLMVSAPDASFAAPQGNRLANNRIHDCGVDYQGAVGIWNGLTDGTVIAHNVVHDLPYTGISVGWQWNPEPTNCRGNLVEYNLIYRCMKALSDGGGIYTLGFQPGTVLRGNVIHDIVRSFSACGAPNNGMFIDEGSKGFLIEDNVIWATSGAPVRHNQNQPDWHTWKGNHFGIAPPVEGKVGLGLMCDGASTFHEPPGSAAIDPPELTAEAWVYLTEYPSGGDNRRWIVNKNDDEWTEGHWGLAITDGRVGAYLNIGGGQANTRELWSEGSPLTLNAWHHLAMTYDGSALKVYCDGKRVGSVDIGKPRVPGSAPIAIGRRQDAYNYLRGTIDEVRVYDRALTPAEIAWHVTRVTTSDATEKGLVGYWGFDDLAEDQAAIRASTDKAGPEPQYLPRLRQADDQPILPELYLPQADTAVEF
jgi:Concanavalin A-like lectin/glucanases superfamily/GH141 insertion domain/Right handed beta helix region